MYSYYKFWKTEEKTKAIFKFYFEYGAQGGMEEYGEDKPVNALR